VAKQGPDAPAGGNPEQPQQPVAGVRGDELQHRIRVGAGPPVGFGHTSPAFPRTTTSAARGLAQLGGSKTAILPRPPQRLVLPIPTSNSGSNPPPSNHAHAPQEMDSAPGPPRWRLRSQRVHRPESGAAQWLAPCRSPGLSGSRSTSAGYGQRT